MTLPTDTVTLYTLRRRANGSFELWHNGETIPSSDWPVGASVFADAAQFGVTGDGVADDSVALQLAIDTIEAASSGQRHLNIPPGRYKIETPLVAQENIVISGAGSRATIFVSEEDSNIISVAGTVGSTAKGVHFEKVGFENGSANVGTAILIDLQFMESEIVFRDCRFDGANHGIAGVRLYNSWLATFENCYFARFPSETLPAVELRSTGGAPPDGHPMNNIRFRDCQFQEVDYGVVLHNSADVSPGPMHNVTFDNCLWKKSVADLTSKGIECLSNQTWNVTIRDCKFEDIDRPIIVRGFNWVIDNVYIEHATTGIAIESGYGHRLDHLSFSGGAGNELGTGVHIKGTVTGEVWVGTIVQVPGLVVTNLFVNDAEEWGAQVAVLPMAGVSHEAFTALTAERAMFVPVRVSQFTRLTGAAIVVGTQNGNLAVALYDASLTRLATSGDVACPATGKQFVAFTSDVYVNPGIYYLCLVTKSGSTATFGHAVPAATSTLALVRFKNSAFPPPAGPVTPDGVSDAMVNILGRVSGGWA